jgi:predicted transcriptional regulator
MGKLLENPDLVQSPIAEVMDKSFPVLSEDVNLETAVKYLKNSPAVLVEEYGRITGIVTRFDVLDVQS